MSTVDSESHSNLLWRGDILTRTSKGRLKEYKILDFLGNGSYGDVFAAESSQMNNYVAIKVFDVERQMRRTSKKELRTVEGAKERIVREIQIHSNLCHPGIVKTLDYFHNGKNRYYLVMELCQSKTLLDVIKEEHAVNKFFNELKASTYTNQIVNALVYLAEKKIYHRDLKPGNCLIDHCGEIKLSDFGLACHYEDVASNNVNGTPNYMCPEVIAKGAHTPTSDVWSLGATIYCMLYKVPPFESDTVDGTYRRIRIGSYSFPTSPLVSSEAQAVIKDCLQPHPQNRVGINLIREYKWLQMTRNGFYPLSRNNLTREPYKEPDVYRSDTVSPSPSTDSGFYSELDLHYEAKKNYCALFSKVADYHSALIQLKNKQLHLFQADFPLYAVAKWAEFKEGFVCELTDGSITCKHSDGVCINWPDNSMFAICARTPFAKPELMSLTEKLSDSDQRRISRLRTMRTYLKKLGCASIPTDRSPKAVENIPYLVHHHRRDGSVFLLFSDGTIHLQLKSGVKLAIWKEHTSQYVGIAFICREGPPVSYRCGAIGCTKSFRIDDSRVPLYHPEKTQESVEEALAWLNIELHSFRLENFPV